jgi:hypothetical protein
VAQHLFEFRAADTKYRYADWNYTFGGVVADMFYVGIPGSNELNLGGGYSFKLGALNLSPLLYFVAGKEGGQRGVKLALLLMYEKEVWKVSFLGHFAPGSGEVAIYQVLDTLRYRSSLFAPDPDGWGAGGTGPRVALLLQILELGLYGIHVLATQVLMTCLGIRIAADESSKCVLLFTRSIYPAFLMASFLIACTAPARR